MNSTSIGLAATTQPAPQPTPVQPDDGIALASAVLSLDGQELFRASKELPEPSGDRPYGETIYNFTSPPRAAGWNPTDQDVKIKLYVPRQDPKAREAQEPQTPLSVSELRLVCAGCEDGEYFQKTYANTVKGGIQYGYECPGCGRQATLFRPSRA